MIMVESKFRPEEDGIAVKTVVTVLKPDSKILPEELANRILSMEVFGLLKDLYQKCPDILLAAIGKLTEEEKKHD